MSEPEELVTDAARHAAVFARRMWLRHARPPTIRKTILLDELAPRLELLIRAVFEKPLRIRNAQSPPHPTLLHIVYGYDRAPRCSQTLPATDDNAIWLPPDSGLEDGSAVAQLYRAMALQQAMRAARGSARSGLLLDSPLKQDVYLLLEAQSADIDLLKILPGLQVCLDGLRAYALQAREPLSAFAPVRQPLERLVIAILQSSSRDSIRELPYTASPAESFELAAELVGSLNLLPPKNKRRSLGPAPLVKDWWTGRLQATDHADLLDFKEDAEQPDSASTPRSARLDRRPEARQAGDDEEDQQSDSGPLIIQGDEPHQMAEDPYGMQRPVDRDQEIGADDFADMLSELPQARLIRSPGTPREVLLSDDAPEFDTSAAKAPGATEGAGLRYPEWNYSNASYQSPGPRVIPLLPDKGNQDWVDATLRQHASAIAMIRRHFAMLRPQREMRRGQLDGHEIDIDAYVQSQAEFRSGGSLSDRLYLQQRSARPQTAISLLIDVSGSTDSWVSGNRRIIDVEREALLLVSLALKELGEPYSIQAFSGDGPEAVTVRDIKTFEQSYSASVALGISALEPENHTRAGAAIRHATSGLMQQSASQRLLLVLTDGKPHDKDHYEGRYAVEDTRQSVLEAKLQGVSIFGMTIDRQAADYMPRIFGRHNYALLQDPLRLPSILLLWIQRILADS